MTKHFTSAKQRTTASVPLSVVWYLVSASSSLTDSNITIRKLDLCFSTASVPGGSPGTWKRTPPKPNLLASVANKLRYVEKYAKSDGGYPSNISGHNDLFAPNVISAESLLLLFLILLHLFLFLFLLFELFESTFGSSTRVNRNEICSGQMVVLSCSRCNQILKPRLGSIYPLLPPYVRLSGSYS